MLSCLCVYVCVYVCTFVCAHTWYGGQRLNSGPSHITLNHLFIYLLCVCAVGDMGLSEDSSQDFMLLPLSRDSQRWNTGCQSVFTQRAINHIVLR